MKRYLGEKRYLPYYAPNMFFFFFQRRTFLHSPGSSHFASSAIRSKQSDRNVYCEQNVEYSITNDGGYFE